MPINHAQINDFNTSAESAMSMLINTAQINDVNAHAMSEM